MIDDNTDKEKPAKQKPVAQAEPEDADAPRKPEKLKLVTTEEERLAAEIEKLRR